MADHTLYSTKSLEGTLQKNLATDRAKGGIEIMLIKERAQNNASLVDWGRYVRGDVNFAGSPAHSANAWGKKLTGDDTVGAVSLIREEKLRLGIEWKQWMWKSDLECS